MSRRTSIAEVLAEKLKVIDGEGNYTTNLHDNSYAKLKFWDEVNDFPCVYVVAGPERREHMPSNFSWGHLSVSIKAYTKGENCQVDLENLIEDIEKVVDSFTGRLEYDTTNSYSTSDVYVSSITTDEGLLAPYGVAEIILLVRYQIMK